MIQKKKIVAIHKIGRKDRYDLTVNTTHNFFANGILIHNTSGRTGYMRKVVNKSKPWWKFWKKESGDKYEYISGTRRTVLVPGAYHNKDDYRAKAHDLFVDKLHKGEIVYYEIVGYDSNGKPIQPPHDSKKIPQIQESNILVNDKMHYSYGCAYGESHVYVYRMGVVGADGTWFEYPWYKVRQRCLEMNVDTVPTYSVFTLSRKSFENDGSRLVNIVASYFLSNPFSELDNSHIMEGIVVRVNDTLYKHKTDWFCELEDIVKDSDRFIDIDDIN